MARQQIKTQVKRIVGRLPRKFVGILALIIVGILMILDGFELLPKGPVIPVSDVLDDYSIHFIDVGQGDSALIRADGKNILIDAGEDGAGTEVVRYLFENGVANLDLIVATHPHSDHIGGLRLVLENIEVDKIILPKLPDELVPTTKAYETLLKLAKKENIAMQFMSNSVNFEFGDLQMKNFMANGEYDNLNDYSIVTQLIYGNSVALFTGDITSVAENDLLDDGMNLEADLLKVAHHGSKGSTTKDFVDAVAPVNSVISVGIENDYGHPHRDVMNKRLKSSSVHLTATDGTIVFSYRDGELKKVSQKG